MLTQLSLNNLSSADLIEKYLYKKAQEDFYTFRRLINPKSLAGWFYKDLTQNLQDFYNSYKNGEKPELIIQSPPQHGKSSAVIEFLAWIFGKDADLRIIYASFSEALGVRANVNLQRIFLSKTYKKIFGSVIAESLNRSNIKQKNKKMLENLNGNGYFRNTTCGGSITGESLDIGIIDDPIKGREEAESPTIREKTQDWFLNDFSTRFSEYGGFLMVLTRWHVDDLAGFIKSVSKKVKIISYPAIAEENEQHRKKGEALFPEFKSIDFLLKQKSRLGTRDFESLYQQNPIILGGNLLKWDWFQIVNEEELKNVKYDFTFITADTAQKDKEINDFTVYTAFGVAGNKLYLLDMYRGKPRSRQREEIARVFYKINAKYPFYGMFIEDKVSGTDLIQRLQDGDETNNFDSLIVRPLQRQRDKISRAVNASSYMETHGVYISSKVKYLEDIKKEVLHFPVANHDDIIDTIIDGVEIAYKDRPLNYGRILNDVLKIDNELYEDITSRYVKGDL